MKKSTILNIDINTVTIPFLEAMIEKPHLTEEDFYPFVDQYIDLANGKESGLAALSFCTFCQLSMVDSAYMTTFYDYMDRQIANGIDPQTNGWYLWPLYRILKETDFDPWAIWVDRCHQRGCEAWISIRMNDAHDRDYEEFMMDEFAYRAKWQDHAIGERYGYYWKCLDYAHDEVRARMLGYLDEQLARYDMDGLELDFMREIYCFDYVNQLECHRIMTQFMRDVRALVASYEQKRGHKITLSVRLARDIEQCLVWGFDVQTWAEERLVDHITPTPRWSSSDSDMPIAEWVRRFPNIRISAGVETLLRHDDLQCADDGSVYMDADTVNGLAAAYYAQGAESINLYNYFAFPQTLCADPVHTNGACTAVQYNRAQDILSRCSDPETVYSTTRRHIVMYQDIVPEDYERYKPLPCSVSGAADLTVTTGPISEDSEVMLYIAFADTYPKDAQILVNGTACSDFSQAVPMEIIEYPKSMALVEGCGIPLGSTLWCCSVPACCLSPMTQCISVSAENAVVTHLELRVLK